MRNRFDRQLEELNVMLVEMGELCEKAIGSATKALHEDDVEFRKIAYDTHDVIDECEREIESLCIKLLLQQQPVARDLHLISAALKMISDMERIGDQARDIAEITEVISDKGRSYGEEHISKMAEVSMKMVTESIDSFVNRDMDVAKSVIIKDDIVDDLFDEVKEDLIKTISEDGSNDYFVDVIMIAKYLERIADHAVNIAERVIFAITGKHVSE